MNVYSDIKQKLQNFGKNNNFFACLFPATVKSSNGFECEIEVQGLTLTNVRLAMGDKADFLVTPKNGSTVLVADFSGGRFENLAVVMFSEVEKVQFHGGNNGELVKIEALKNNLNALKNQLNALQNAIVTGLNGVGAGTAAAGSAGATAFTGAMAGKTVNFQEMKNEKITQ